MNAFPGNHRIRFGLAGCVWLALLSALSLDLDTLAQPAPLGPPVGLLEDATNCVLTNAFVSVRVSKRSGDLTSIRFKGLELLDQTARRSSAYWSHNVANSHPSRTITIDPHANGGERAEISLKGVSDGRPMGRGPGGSVIADIEIRYSLGRNDSGIYTYCIFSHPTNYPATSLGEARFCAKLNDAVFDWMTVDARRNLKMPSAYDWNHGTVMNMKEARRMNTGLYRGQVEHKYDYAANQFDVRAWGWSSTRQHVGLWFVNPSVEYLSGGPTKVELSAHRDATSNADDLDAPAPPTLLNYWRSSHYGGSLCVIAATDNWTKVVGPFLIYANSGPTPGSMWSDALVKAETEAAAWPFDWVAGVDYPHKHQRGIVTGRILLNDPQSASGDMNNLLVGLSAPDYATVRINRNGRGLSWSEDGGEAEKTKEGAVSGRESGRETNPGSNETRQSVPLKAGVNGVSAKTVDARRRSARGGSGSSGGLEPSLVEWQNDAKHYEYWVRADPAGEFTIPNVRPGVYTLHAFADGVLGEFTRTNLVIESGESLYLGRLRWQPDRYGRQLWDIGVPNRTASEFFEGNDYFHWGWYLEYPKLFPTDVDFVIGKNDYRRDWFFEQLPRNPDPANTTGRGTGLASTWKVRFHLSAAVRGKATLRLAICGVGARSLAVAMNGQEIGSVTGLVYDATINRDGIAGMWAEHDMAFDASLLRAGENVLELKIPGGSLMSGVMYDYLRLELDGAAVSPEP